MMSDWRRLMSVEQDKTREYVKLALTNTQALHRSLVRLMWAGALMGAVLIVLVIVLVRVWVYSR